MKRTWMAFIPALLIGINSLAQSVFPPDPFNGMQVNYTISGATISKYTDVPGFTWTRSLVIQDIQRGGVLSVSGSLTAGGLGCTIVVMVSADGKPSSGTYEVKPGAPQNFTQQVPIPKNAKSASISINMHGHYSMGGGSRGVIVQGDWTERWGAENKPTDPNKYKPEPSIVAKQKELLKLYFDPRRIPNGIASSGEQNNKLWWSNNIYDDYVCGAYQTKILDMFDKIRMGNNPDQKKLLENFEYGPVQTYVGPIKGGHQAVMIYPKGTNWKETGIILDPWPEQKAKSYTIQEWKKIFPMGPEPSGYYKGQYPLCGGVSYPDTRTTKLTKPESDWFNSLSKKRQEPYTRIKDAEERKKRLKFDFANRDNDTRVMADCPLDLYIRDGSGRISGFPDGVFRAEIPDVLVNRIRLADGTWWSEFSYPSNPEYTVMFKGTGNGKATIWSGTNMNADPGRRSIYKNSFPVARNQEYVMEQSFNGIKVNKAGQDPTTRPSKEEKIFDNGNIYGVTSGPVNPTQFTLSRNTYITRIENYHYFNNGKQPGAISLMNEFGEQFGPWYATGTPGQGGVQNAYWVVRPNMILPAGTYTVIDSDPSTWSTNNQSYNRGFTTVFASGY